MFADLRTRLRALFRRDAVEVAGALGPLILVGNFWNGNLGRSSWIDLFHRRSKHIIRSYATEKFAILP